MSETKSPENLKQNTIQRKEKKSNLDQKDLDLRVSHHHRKVKCKPRTWSSKAKKKKTTLKLFKISFYVSL